MKNRRKELSPFVKGLTNFMMILPSSRTSILPAEAGDARNIYSDWEAVGNDIEKVMGKYGKQAGFGENDFKRR